MIVLFHQSLTNVQLVYNCCLVLDGCLTSVGLNLQTNNSGNILSHGTSLTPWDHGLVPWNKDQTTWDPISVFIR